VHWPVISAESLIDAPRQPNFRSSDVCSSNPEVHFVLPTGLPFAAWDYAESWRHTPRGYSVQTLVHSA
jgi:hypothetical protein